MSDYNHVLINYMQNSFWGCHITSQISVEICFTERQIRIWVLRQGLDIWKISLFYEKPPGVIIFCLLTASNFIFNYISFFYQLSFNSTNIFCNISVSHFIHFLDYFLFIDVTIASIGFQSESPDNSITYGSIDNCLRTRLISYIH